jgi:hypothetical protein
MAKKMREVDVKDYAELVGIRSQSVYRKIKQGKLQTKKRDGKTYILTDIEPEEKSDVTTQNFSNDFVANYIKHLEDENKRLQEKVDYLITSKEQLLIAERERIEKIYRDKDSQLKSILELIQKRLIENKSTHQTVPSYEPVIEAMSEGDMDALIELDAYLEHLNIQGKERRMIENRFTMRLGEDERVIMINNKMYMDIEKYDYRSLLFI